MEYSAVADGLRTCEKGLTPRQHLLYRTLIMASLKQYLVIHCLESTGPCLETSRPRLFPVPNGHLESHATLPHRTCPPTGQVAKVPCLGPFEEARVMQGHGKTTEGPITKQLSIWHIVSRQDDGEISLIWQWYSTTPNTLLSHNLLGLQNVP